MIIEIRTYKTKPGMLGEFLQIFRSTSMPAHRAAGMTLLGPFVSVEDPDTFVWMRGFPDMDSRARMRDQFYAGEAYKQQLEPTLIPMLEKYDIIVVEAQDGLGDWQ